MKTFIALVDDHTLIRNAIAGLLKESDYRISFQADNGKDLIAQIEKNPLPSIILMDINMPNMDGYETSAWLKLHYPEIKIIALSMYDNDIAIIRMLHCGAKGYILKDCEPEELFAALNAVRVHGFYYSDIVTGRLIYLINQNDKTIDNTQDIMKFKERELQFLKFACSELTYKEIADKMKVSVRTVDGYRDDLFEKLNIKSRVGLVLFALKHGVVTLP
jgi:two-component system invasion response regulator UvrY